MVNSAFVASGHGYEISERGRCEAFDGFEILANPLGGFDNASRASRSFPGKSGPGVTYDSHAVYLMRRKGDAGDKWASGRDYFVAVHHGGGRYIWRLPACHNYQAETLDALLAMPERALYSLLWGIIEALDDTKRAAEQDTAQAWRRATLGKRVKVSRQPAKGRAFVWIEPAREEGESDAQHALRCAFAKPSGVR